MTLTSSSADGRVGGSIPSVGLPRGSDSLYVFHNWTNVRYLTPEATTPTEFLDNGGSDDEYYADAVPFGSDANPRCATGRRNEHGGGRAPGRFGQRLDGDVGSPA